MVYWKKKKILYLHDECPSNFNTLGCGYSLFPLRDSRGKRTREPASAKLPLALKRDANLVPRALPPVFYLVKKGKKSWEQGWRDARVEPVLTCDQALFSFRLVKHSGATGETKNRAWYNSSTERLPPTFFDWLTFNKTANQNFFCLHDPRYANFP